MTKRISLISVRPTVCLSVCVSVCLSVCLSGCLSVYLSIWMSVYLSIWMSLWMSLCLSVRLSVCLSVCLSICVSGYLSVCLSVSLFSVAQSELFWTTDFCLVDLFYVVSQLISIIIPFFRNRVLLFTWYDNNIEICEKWC